MCGITGIISCSQDVPEVSLTTYLKEMSDSLKHRGPDDCGTWVDASFGIGFAHRRLSIIDVSKDGHQPMVSSSGRYVISYNGEVYNFEELRANLEKNNYQFQGHSDTEIILEYIEENGIQNAVKNFNGMFAFSLFDKKKRKLYLVRDRLGIKPLYYTFNGSFFIFGSELKALMKSNKLEKRIDKTALGQYFKFNYIPAPKTIFENVHKLEPGKILEFDLEKKDIILDTYWDAKKVIKKSLSNQFEGNIEEATEELKNILDEVIGCRMVSDVPLGAFLSGGIDSSLVVATMQKLSQEPVKSFSIGFKQAGFNEAIHAKKVAQHLGTDHTELYVTDSEAREIIPELSNVWDEPFADSSQIPTYLLSKLTRKHVTVSLSGDGGDEIFGGYQRYSVTNAVWDKLEKVPFSIRKKGAKFLKWAPPNTIDSVYGIVSPFLNENLQFNRIKSKISTFSEVLEQNTQEDVYDRFITHWGDTNSLINSTLDDAKLNHSFSSISTNNFIEKMMIMDLLTYLPDDILTKVDRASMASSLEARVPLIDHRLVEFAWKLPFDFKVSSQKSKWILKKLLYEYVPQKIIDRPKMGFAIPIAEWLRGPLKEWSTDLLCDSQLDKHGLLNKKLVQDTLDHHLKGELDREYHLWDLLMFQSWYDNWMDD